MAGNRSRIIGNTSNEVRPDWQSHFNDILDRTILIISITIVVSNSIALAIFLKKTFLVKKSTYLQVNLTIADLLVGLSGCMAGISDTKIDTTSYGSLSEQIVSCGERILIRAMTSASILSLSVIAIERAVAVFWPFHHRLPKRWHYFTAIGLVWFLAIVRPALILFDCFKIIDLGELATKILSFVFSTTFVLILVLSYFSIWIKLKFFTKFRHCRTIQENSKLTKTLFIVTLVSLATWLPFVIEQLVFISGFTVNFAPYTLLAIRISLFCSSFLNVFVYLFRMPEFRNELKKIFCRCLTNWKAI